MEKTRILVIDDEEDICAFSKSILERTGKFEVFFSTNGKEGLSLAKTHKPDLILLDIMLPDIDGPKVAENLAESLSTKTIPVVFLTALVHKEEIERGSGQIGGRFFISKPINSQQLVERIQAILKLT